MKTNLTEYLSGIANSIRIKKGTNEPINAQDFENEILSIESGITPTGTLEITENGNYDVVDKANVSVNVQASSEGDMLQTKVDITNSCSYLFYKFSGNNVDFISGLDTSNVTDMSNMFQECSKLTTIPQLDTSKVIYMNYMFYMCSKLTTIPQLDTRKVYNMDYMFFNCSALTTIPQLDTRNVSGMSGIFSGCKVLENLTLKNIKRNLQIGSGTSWGHLLTLGSLLNTCQECINVNASRTLTVGTANLEKLASVYVKLTNAPEEDSTLPKLPMVLCGSSDDGAMTVQDYMALKNWTLA